MMMKVFVKTTTDCGYYPGDPVEIDAVVTIDINCDGCHRLIYQKEVVSHDDGYH